jgi:alpha-beta hydrolase superfamily lysophospholipase
LRFEPKISGMSDTDQQTERREGHFRGHEGIELFYQTWSRPNARGTLVITHGISEHSEAYHKTAEALVPLGWNICAWDLRGHGRSEGKRGFVDRFRSYSLDLAHFLSFLKKSGRLDQPFALVGHSMGGLITLRHLIDPGEAPLPNAVVLSSPLLGFGLEVPQVKDLAARLLSRVLPGITLFNEIRYEDLSRDLEHVKGYATDPLRHDKISPAVYLGMIESIAYVKANAGRLELPTLVMAAGDERIVSLPAIKAFFPLIGSADKSLIIYEGCYHEIFNDLDREKVYRDLDAFLKERMK